METNKLPRILAVMSDRRPGDDLIEKHPNEK
jgi:hypothetical protein